MIRIGLYTNHGTIHGVQVAQTLHELKSSYCINTFCNLGLHPRLLSLQLQTLRGNDGCQVRVDCARPLRQSYAVPESTSTDQARQTPTCAPQACSLHPFAMAFVGTPVLPARQLGSRRGTCARRAPRCQIPPPNGYWEPPLSEEQRGPPRYAWDPTFPGTLKPGSVDDNFPLEKVLASDVYRRMEYVEMDIDERTPQVFPPDEDFLEWLAREGKLLPRGLSDDEFDTEAEKQMTGITEEDLEFADDDSKMLAYYSRQGEGSAAGASSDFGGFSESSASDATTGF